MALTETRRRVLRLAWPIVLANSAVPLLGLADTAVIGNTGTVQALGAIALGAVVFDFDATCGMPASLRWRSSWARRG